MTYARLALLVLLALLSGCTGTRSNRAPTLLLIGYADAGQGRIGVVADTFLTEGAVSGRFLFLGSAPLPTGQLPVHYDVSDRDGLRSELFVLSREGATANASVSVFPIGALSPEVVTPALTPRLELTYADLPRPNPDAPFAICPTRIQVTRTGRYAAVMHDLSLCDASNLNEALDVVDLTATPPRVVRRWENVSIVPNAMFMVQDDGADRLYYFSDESGGARLRVVRLPELLEQTTSAIIQGSFKNDAATVVRDLSLIGGELIALQGSRFTAIANPAAPSPNVRDPVPTGSGSFRLVPTNSPGASAVMVIGVSRFTVHATSQDVNPAFADLTLTDGSLEPVGGFVYFVGPGANNLPIFDLREYDPARGDLRLSLGLSFGLPQVSNPVFVTWAQSLLLPGN